MRVQHDEHDGLRAALTRHNRHVFFLASATLALSAAGWMAIYFGIYWFALLALTVVRGNEAAITPDYLPAFVIASITLCFSVWLVRRRTESPPRDHFSVFAVAADLVLAIPRATVAIGNTLEAFQFLKANEIEVAWKLMQRLGEIPALPVHQVPLELPEPVARERILLALQIAGLIEFQRRAGTLVLTLRNQEARALAQGKIRIRAKR